MKIVVITGCLGLIGSYVTRSCLKNGWRVLGIDSETYASNKEFLAEFSKYDTFSYLKEDICTLSYLPDCDYVINVAAETHVGNSIINSDVFLKTNVVGVQNLLNLIKSKPVNVDNRPILMHFSTDEVYGDIESGLHTETDLLKPSNPYSASKAAGDMLILAWNRTYNIDYVILRPTNNYGIGQYPEKLLPLAVKVLQRNKKIRLHNKGTPVRNWLHAEDTANAVISIIKSGVKNEIYNISGNCEQANIVTVKHIIDAFFETQVKDYEKHLDLSYVREGQDVRYALDDSKLKALGWQPQKQFKDEIKSLVEYYKSHFKW
jgi:dTDP-glucose 4,6-dehydratase